MKDSDKFNVVQCETIKTDKSYSREQFTKIIQATFTDCYALIIKKNSDYTKINPDNPFHNFEQEAVSIFLRSEVGDKVDGITLGLLTRLNDKRRRRENLLLTAGSLVIDETIEDTIKDEINYLAILLCHIHLHGRHKQTLDKGEPEQLDWKDQVIAEKNSVIVSLHETLDMFKRDQDNLSKQLANKDEMLRSKNARSRNRKSK